MQPLMRMYLCHVGGVSDGQVVLEGYQLRHLARRVMAHRCEHSLVRDEGRCQLSLLCQSEDGL